ncbi:hypothetical protein V6N13_114939 [Hibiscus sabdariffa]
MAKQQLLTGGGPVHKPLFGDSIFSAFRLLWQTAYVIMTTVVAMLLPFFSGVVGLLGATLFWPLISRSKCRYQEKTFTPFAGHEYG